MNNILLLELIVWTLRIILSHSAIFLRLSIFQNGGFWQKSENEKFLSFSNIGILHTVGKEISCWTTFLLTANPENVLNVRKRTKTMTSSFSFLYFSSEHGHVTYRWKGNFKLNNFFAYSKTLKCTQCEKTHKNYQKLWRYHFHDHEMVE